jgi:hypothetical protein
MKKVCDCEVDCLESSKCRGITVVLMGKGTTESWTECLGETEAG